MLVRVMLPLAGSTRDFRLLNTPVELNPTAALLSPQTEPPLFNHFPSSCTHLKLKFNDTHLLYQTEKDKNGTDIGICGMKFLHDETNFKPSATIIIIIGKSIQL